MPRPAGPWWWKARGRWAATINGRRETEKTGIGQHEKPMNREKIPLRVVDWYEKLVTAKAPEVSSSSELTVALLVGKYLIWAEAEAEAGKLSLGTFRGHQTKLGRFCGFKPSRGGQCLGDKPVRLVTATDLQEAVHAWEARYKPHYVRGLIRTIQTAFSWAARPVPRRDPERLIGANPLAGFRSPILPQSPNRYIEARKFRTFLRWSWRRTVRMRAKRRLTSRFDRVFILMVQFLRHTGARPGEACKLLWGDIDWPEEVAILPPERWKNGKKTGRPREIPLNVQALRILRTLQRQGWRHDTHVFAHRRGKNGVARGASAEQGEPWNSTAVAKKLRDWRGMAVKDGVDIETNGPLRIVAYIARHTYISDGLMTGISSDIMASSTGTSTPQIDNTYGHIQRDLKRKLAKELAEKRRKLGG